MRWPGLLPLSSRSASLLRLPLPHWLAIANDLEATPAPRSHADAERVRRTLQREVPRVTSWTACSRRSPQRGGPARSESPACARVHITVPRPSPRTSPSRRCSAARPSGRMQVHSTCGKSRSRGHRRRRTFLLRRCHDSTRCACSPRCHRRGQPRCRLATSPPVASVHRRDRRQSHEHLHQPRCPTTRCPSRAAGSR